MSRVLIIDSDTAMARQLGAVLQSLGLEWDWRSDPREGLECAVGGQYALIILAPSPAGLDAAAMASTLRALGVLTPQWVLDNPPPAPADLLARVRRLLQARPAGPGERLRLANLELDLRQRQAHRAGQLLALQPTEYKVLECLMRHSGTLLSRQRIFETVWGYRFDPGTNLIDVHIARLRRKVDRPGQIALIRTVHGRGYLMVAPA